LKNISLKTFSPLFFILKISKRVQKDKDMKMFEKEKIPKFGYPKKKLLRASFMFFDLMLISLS
jgi:hypothetical protein